ncbi:MAG: multiple sugar transport system permease protein [Actinomycetota bacterium]|jgi:multiple sugar transport system permease protein|nr:multiple sugar transport system permease protein [Actinomycetota bacterium]
MSTIATTVARPATPPPPAPKRRSVSPARIGAHVFLFTAAVLWAVPILWAMYTSLRPYDETSKNGYLSMPKHLTFSNFTTAWKQANLLHYFWNSVIITVPAVLFTLFFAACVAYVLTRFRFWFNIPLLILFAAGNLLPPQVIITPLFRIYLSLHVPHFVSNNGILYNSFAGLIVINATFQLGFCVFVLSNYMKTIPHEITEAALIDGASVWTRFWKLTLPLCRPALAALATLLTTWIYNDFFWAITLISSGSKRPITSALANLQGQFFVNQNLLAAGALITAVPTLLVYVLLQKQFIAGLSLGSSKG